MKKTEKQMIDKSMLSGSMAMLVLKLLSEREMYGYEMIRTLRERSENVFELKAGTLYPLLHSLKKKKLLTSYEKETEGKTRIYYSITPVGRVFVKEKEEMWHTFHHAVDLVMEG